MISRQQIVQDEMFWVELSLVMSSFKPQLDGGVVLLENPSFTTSLVLDAPSPRVAALHTV